MNAVVERITSHLPAEPRQPCARCGRYGRISQMLLGVGYAVFFCGDRDRKACEKRARRRAR